MSDEKTKTLSVHVKRSKAREKERKVQGLLNSLYGLYELYDDGMEATNAPSLRTQLADLGVPEWARGVRVESAAGGLMHTVIATSNRGH